MQIAGKYARAIAEDHNASAVAGGLGAAGLAAMGSDGESPGRTALEVLGAGALGAAVGSRLPGFYAGNRAKSRQALMDIADVKAGRQSPMGEGQRQKAQTRAQVIDEAIRAGMNPEQVKQAVERGLKTGEGISNIGGAALGVGAAGLGGSLVGGGVANVGNMLGLSIDPEAPGSSNTQNSRLSMQTQQLPM